MTSGIIVEMVTPRCPACGQDETYEADLGEVFAWQGGELIQNVWPDLSPEEREQRMTGYHPSCWTRVFGHLDDEEEA